MVKAKCLYLRMYCLIFTDGNFTPGVVRIMVRISVVSRFSNPLAV